MSFGLKGVNIKNLEFHQTFFIKILNDLTEKSKIGNCVRFTFKKQNLNLEIKNLIYFFFNKKFFLLKKNWIALKKVYKNGIKVDKLFFDSKTIFNLGYNIDAPVFRQRRVENKNFGHEIQFYEDFGFTPSLFGKIAKFKSYNFKKKYAKYPKNSIQMQTFHEKLFGFLKSNQKKNMPINLLNFNFGKERGNFKKFN